MKNKNKKTLGLIALIVISAFFLPKIGEISVSIPNPFNGFGNKDEIEKTATVRDCYDWRGQYSILTTGNRKAVRLNRDTHILFVDSEWSPWITTDSQLWWVSEIDDKVEAQKPTQETVKGKEFLDMSEYSRVRFRGEGCVLITSHESVYRKWAQIPPQ